VQCVICNVQSNAQTRNFADYRLHITHYTSHILMPADPTPDQKPLRSKSSGFAQVAKYTHLGFVLPAAVFLGWIVGAALDRWLGTTWITIAGIVFGIIVGFYEIIRVAMSMGKEK